MGLEIRGLSYRSAAAAAKSLQSCPTLCDPIDGSPPGSPVPGTLQARTLEWVAISFSNAWKWKVKAKSLSHVRLFRPHGLQSTRLLRPWDFPGKSTGVRCHCLLHIDLHPFLSPWVTVGRSLYFSRAQFSHLQIRDRTRHFRRLLAMKFYNSVQ